MRDAENELYDRGCDLVEAAAAIRRAAGPEASAALPALLGCFEVALGDLYRTSAALIAPAAEAPDPRTERAQRGLANLAAALHDAEAAAAAARALAARRAAAGTR
jgi:hypothetical protein